MNITIQASLPELNRVSLTDLQASGKSSLLKDCLKIKVEQCPKSESSSRSDLTEKFFQKFHDRQNRYFRHRR